MRLFDTHCHLDFPAFDPDREELLRGCRERGFVGIVVPGVTREGWAGISALCATHRDLLHPALGLHPLFTDHHREADLEELARQIRRHRPVAIGEIGLDFYLPDVDRGRQQRYFELQLDLAQEAGLPVILHVRKAHDIVLHALRRRQLVGGIAHAFSGSRQQAEQYLELGFKLGFGGAVTYPRARRLRRLARELPLSGLVLETDAPDMAPAGHHGERNRPDHLFEVLDTMAQIRDEAPERIAEQTTANALALFGLATGDTAS